MPETIATEPRYDAFISYTKLDQAAARTVLHLLRAFGQRVFLDEEGIAAGQLWEPAIRQAAAQVKTLILIWSRNATASTYIPQELQLVPRDCTILPIMLDGAPLPEGVKDHHALRGLQVHERILARATALTKQKLPRSRVVSQILDELREDGYDLTSEQRNAVALVVFRGLGGGVIGWWVLQWLASRFGQLVTSPAVLGVTSSAASLAFVGGYLLSDKAAANEVGAHALPPTVEVAQACTAQERALQDRTQEVSACRTQLDSAHQELTSCESARDAKTERCAGIKNKLAEVEQGLARCNDDLQSWRVAADAAQREEAQCTRERAALQTRLDQAAAAQEKMARELMRTRAALSDCAASKQSEPKQFPASPGKPADAGLELHLPLNGAMQGSLHDLAPLFLQDASVSVPQL